MIFICIINIIDIYIDIYIFNVNKNRYIKRRMGCEVAEWQWKVWICQKCQAGIAFCHCHFYCHFVIFKVAVSGEVAVMLTMLFITVKNHVKIHVKYVKSSGRASPSFCVLHNEYGIVGVDGREKLCYC